MLIAVPIISVQKCSHFLFVSYWHLLSVNKIREALIHHMIYGLMFVFHRLHLNAHTRKDRYNTRKHVMHYYSPNLVSYHVIDFKMGNQPLTQITVKMDIC
jgi:hypothetical protein